MKHLGILAHSAEGAALCFRTFCQEGFQRLGPDEHPDVTLDCIALARSMAAWDQGDYAVRSGPRCRSARSGSRGRARTSSSARTTPRTRHSSCPARNWPFPGLHIAEVVADQAARDRRRRVGVLGTRYLMDGPVYPRALAARGIATETA